MSRTTVKRRDIASNTISPLRHAAGAQTIYVIDRDQSVRKSLHSALSLFGYTVEGFESASDVLAAPGFSQAACVVMMNSAEESGAEIQTALRERESVAPVFVVNGAAADIVRQVLRQLKSAGYFDRPVEALTFLDAIKSGDTRSAGL